MITHYSQSRPSVLDTRAVVESKTNETGGLKTSPLRPGLILSEGGASYDAPGSLKESTTRYSLSVI
jgi:hypothetical protein